MEKYDHKKIELKWQKKWEKEKLYKTSEDKDKPKYYVLDMFPYPSGAGLHVGHVESYTATDIMSRYWRLKGKNVLHPQGWDAFGLPAENYAIQTKIHPAVTTKKAITTFKAQMQSIGFSYDWSREAASNDPEYYKWTQWFFLLFYKNGLAYKKKAKVNWCDSCQTVLANEQAEGGICERCKSEVVQKDMEQWFFKITDFIEDKGETAGLLTGLDKVDWPESTKAAQKNWIGKSAGAQFEMKIKGSDLKMEVYTTRLDTVFGMTYAVIAPEHKLVQELKGQIKNWPEVKKYLKEAKKKTDLERMETKEKTGVKLAGVEAVNPFNNQAIPVFAADYVLAHYGTGAVMAVPAHDERDFEFAKKYNLPIRFVIASDQGERGNLTDGKFRLRPDVSEIAASPAAPRNDKEVFTDDGVLINSGKYNGLTSEQAREKMAEWLEEEKIGARKINYKIRDWLVSRQRYWGAPIPIIYCAKCGEVPVPEKDLPVRLPTDVDFMPTGESPLVKSKKFHDVKCPKCGSPARRESDTMDTFVCSSWYYLRYADPKNKKEFADREALKKWLPVDLYVGGAEHTVLHLLYSRFFTKVLHNLGYLGFDEPFLKLRHQGIILAEDGRKMSKSFGNIINPDDVVKEYGADALRMFEMFMGPLADAKPWNTRGIIGISRFLEKIWQFYGKIKLVDCGGGKKPCENALNGLPKMLHKTIKKVSEDMENLRFNTAISQMMIFMNFAVKFDFMPRAAAEKFLILLSPFAPHLAEELWQKLGNKQSVFKEKWPEYSEALAKDETMNLVVQVNGKVRETIEVSADISEEEAKKLALSSEKIKKWIENKEVVKIIFVKGKLVNIVVK